MNKIINYFLIFISLFCLASCSYNRNLPHDGYVVIAIINAKPGMEKDLEYELKKIVKPSRNESSNIEYRLHKSVKDSTEFTLYEVWKSPELHQEQFSKPYIKDLIGKLDSIIISPPKFVFAKEVI